MTDTKTQTATRQTFEAEVQPRGPLATVPAPSLAEQLAGKPKLAAALVKAIEHCKSVPHDARNAHHGYAYTSAEAIFEEARVALLTNGLALIPLEQTVNGHEREGPDRYELVQARLLLHVSGESVLCRSAWPITPGQGRPLDKATAASDTLSLGYFLRDLLLMARVDPADDIAGRKDTPAAKADRPAKPKADAPKTGLEFEHRCNVLAAWCVEQGFARDNQALLSRLHAWGVGVGLEKVPLANWPQDKWAAASKQAKKIAAELKQASEPQAKAG